MDSALDIFNKGGSPAPTVKNSTGQSGNPQVAGQIVNAAGGTGAFQGAATAIMALGFYGGETCDQIRKICPVNIIGAPQQILSKDEKSFYKNVHIPRKKV